MKRIAHLLAGLAIVAGCQRTTGTTASVPYRADIARLCDVSERTVQRDWEKARLLLYKQIDAADSCSKT